MTAGPQVIVPLDKTSPDIPLPMKAAQEDSSAQKNFHQMKNSMKNPKPTTGAARRSAASQLTFCAALRYFRLSSRSEVERFDIPAFMNGIQKDKGGTDCRASHHAKADLPCSSS